MTTGVERGEWDSKPQAMLGESIVFIKNSYGQMVVRLTSQRFMPMLIPNLRASKTIPYNLPRHSTIKT